MRVDKLILRLALVSLALVMAAWSAALDALGGDLAARTVSLILVVHLGGLAFLSSIFGSDRDDAAIAVACTFSLSVGALATMAAAWYTAPLAASLAGAGAAVLALYASIVILARLDP